MQTKAVGLSVSFSWNTLKTNPSAAPPRSRCKHASCLHGDYIYMIGGKDGNVALREIWRFHVKDTKWEKLTYRGDTLPYLEGHSIISHKRLLLLFGGGFQDDLSESCLWIINPDLEHIRRFWAEAGSSQPGERRHHSAVVYDNTMYVYGGYINLKGSSAELWAFHIEDEEWEMIPSTQRQENTPGSRHGHTAVVYGRDMWLLGGSVDLIPKSDLWKFSFHTHRWERIKLKYGPPPLAGHSCCVVKENMIVFGGEANGILNNDIWVLCFDTLKWSHVQFHGLSPSVRTWHSAVPITVMTLRGDSSVRTSSMPYLKQKGQMKKLRRPKSSPAYSSTRNRVRPDSKKPLQAQETGFNSDVKTCERPKSLGINVSSNFAIVMTTPKEKNIEDVSPLLYNRQQSTSSVTSSNGGIDNPSLDMQSSIERINVTNNTTVERLQDENTPQNTKTVTPCSSVEGCYVKQLQGNSQNIKVTQTLPGQVLQSVNSRYIKRRSHRFQRGALEMTDFRNSIGVIPQSSELVLEDLETHTDKRTCMPSIDRRSLYQVDKPSSYTNIFDTNSSAQEKNVGFEMHSFTPMDTHTDNDTSQKFSSLSNVFETNFTDIQTDREREGLSLRRNSFHCWMEDNEQLGSKSSGSCSDIQTLLSSESGCQRDTEKNKMNCDSGKDDQTDKETKAEESLPVELDTPYLLVMGGKENKGCNLRREPLVVWRCNIIVRHSDISHGQFQKSSVVI